MEYLGYELKDYIIKAIKDLGFKEFTPIQIKVFDNVHNNKNIIAKSKTGSGKTHSFLIPIFNELNEDDKSVFATIIAPTKELATQIYKVSQHIASFSSKSINIKLYTAGNDRDREIAKLSGEQPQIVIGTPGKIKDLAITSNSLKIYTSKFLVIDEADMSFESGFQEDINDIVSVTNNAKLMLFSATMSEAILPSIKKYMTNVLMLDIDNTNDNKISHMWIPLKHRERKDMLLSLLKIINPYLAIIFVNKKENANELSRILTENGYFVGIIHGDLSQRERRRVIEDAKKLKYQFIVATDLAARGIDIEGVSHIINYELPYDYEFYLHRSGRTGRMYNDGIVYSFYEEVNSDYLDNLNKKGIKPEYYDIKNGEIVPFKGRNTRAQRIKPKTNYELEASKFIPKAKKVKPGYKKKRQAMVNELADKLRKNDKKRRHR